MSDSDSFIDEVSEEVRRDRLYGYLRRYGWIGVLLVLLLVGGAAWNEWRKARDAAEAQAVGDGILDALETENEAARIDALASLGVDGKVLAVPALLTASEMERAGDPEGAMAALERVIADDAVRGVYRDLATLKWVMVSDGLADDAARREALDPLTRPGTPFRMLALEQAALIDLAAGDTGAALEGLGRIVEDAETTQGLRERAESLIVALGGEAAPRDDAGSQ